MMNVPSEAVMLREGVPREAVNAPGTKLPMFPQSNAGPVNDPAGMVGVSQLKLLVLPFCV